MKKIYAFTAFFVVLLCMSFVIAKPAGIADKTGLNHDAVIAAGGINRSDNAMVGARIKVGTYKTENGQQLQIQKRKDNKTQLRVRDVDAHTELNITQKQIQNKTRLNVKLSNGMNAEIKVMPDTASETALARLRLKVCNSTNNCSIELKEVGQGDNVRAAYDVQVQKEAKVLGLFKTRMRVEAQVDAENGEVIQTNKPWWAFLASESDETTSEDNSTEAQ